jgi:antitoxin (DNA-binding transcriptional repressor) of toxin-antitoxin stability system
MIEKTITVTEAARNFADCVNRAHYQDTTFVLLKNGVAVARIVPENRKPSTGRELAAALAKVRLSPEESAAWLRDLEEARKNLLPQRDKWL